MLTNRYDPKTAVIIRRINYISNDPELKKTLKEYYFTQGELKLIRHQVLLKRYKLRNSIKTFDHQLFFNFS